MENCNVCGSEKIVNSFDNNGKECVDCNHTWDNYHEIELKELNG